MGITVNISGGADFEPVSEGIHAAVLADIVDLGVIETGFGPKEKVQFVWLTDEADENGRTKYLFKRYTKSLHEKASLRKDFIKIAGRDLTAEEIKSGRVDIEAELLGKQNQLLVEHSEGREGKVFANVQAIMKSKPGAKVAIPSDFQRKKDRPANSNGPSAVKAAGGGKAVAARAYSKGPITDDDIPF